MATEWNLRLAEEHDIEKIAALIPVSVRRLQAGYYSPAQMEAALGPVFAVDRQLILDRTYFVVEADDQLIACGGWSRRQSLCGGDLGRTACDPPLDPARDAARIRAFFVHPDWSRRGIGRRILEECERASQRAGFTRAELAATLAGEPLYAACGYRAIERYGVPLANAPDLPVVRMTKSF